MEIFINSSYFYKLIKFIVKIYIHKKKEVKFYVAVTYPAMPQE